MMKHTFRFLLAMLVFLLFVSASEAKELTVHNSHLNAKKLRQMGYDVTLSVPDLNTYVIDTNGHAPPTGSFTAPEVHAFSEPYWAYEWALQQTYAHWSLDYKGQGVTVAVLDTGVKQDHADFAGLQFAAGYNFISNTTDTNDDHIGGGHGTMVTSIIAAQDNGAGIVGVAPNVTIMPVKVLDSAGSGDTAQVAAGITWATDHGANVINLSLGAPSDGGDLMQNAIQYATDHGVFVVCASGNDGGALSYPAALPGCISVGATSEDGVHADFSNYGSELDFAAGGVYIPVASNTGSWAFGSGTSFAAPHLSGVIAILLSAGSTDPYADISNNAQDLETAGWDQYTGWGYPDLSQTLGLTDPADTTDPGATDPGTDDPGTNDPGTDDPPCEGGTWSTTVNKSVAIDLDCVGTLDSQPLGTFDEDTFIYTPPLNFRGTDTFSYDGGTITINILRKTPVLTIGIKRKAPLTFKTTTDPLLGHAKLTVIIQRYKNGRWRSYLTVYRYAPQTSIGRWKVPTGAKFRARIIAPRTNLTLWRTTKWLYFRT